MIHWSKGCKIVSYRVWEALQNSWRSEADPSDVLRRARERAQCPRLGPRCFLRAYDDACMHACWWPDSPAHATSSAACSANFQAFPREGLLREQSRVRAWGHTVRAHRRKTGGSGRDVEHQRCGHEHSRGPPHRYDAPRVAAVMAVHEGCFRVPSVPALAGQKIVLFACMHVLILLREKKHTSCGPAQAAAPLKLPGLRGFRGTASSSRRAPVRGQVQGGPQGQGACSLAWWPLVC
jgi:hypothetical protein